MIRPGKFRIALVALLASCVLVCPECWIGALAASLSGVEHQDAISCVCACCVHAGPAPRLPAVEESDDGRHACDQHGDALSSAPAPHDSAPVSPADCICRGAIASLTSLELGLLRGPAVWGALPESAVSGPEVMGQAPRTALDDDHSAPTGRQWRLALGSLLI